MLHKKRKAACDHAPKGRSHSGYCHAAHRYQEGDQRRFAVLLALQRSVQAAANGMTLFDLPHSRTAKDLEQWQAIIDWVQSSAG